MFSEDRQENYLLSVRRRRFVYESIAPSGAAALESTAGQVTSASKTAALVPALHKTYDEARDRSTLFSRGVEHLEDLSALPGVLSAFGIGQGRAYDVVIYDSPSLVCLPRRLPRGRR